MGRRPRPVSGDRTFPRRRRRRRVAVRPDLQLYPRPYCRIHIGWRRRYRASCLPWSTRTVLEDGAPCPHGLDFARIRRTYAIPRRGRALPSASRGDRLAVGCRFRARVSRLGNGGMRHGGAHCVHGLRLRGIEGYPVLELAAASRPLHGVRIARRHRRPAGDHGAIRRAGCRRHAPGHHLDRHHHCCDHPVCA